MKKLLPGFGLLCLGGLASTVAGQSDGPLVGLLALCASLAGLWYLLSFLALDERK